MAKIPQALIPKTPGQVVLLIIISLVIVFIISQFILPELKQLKVSIFGYKGEDGTKGKPISGTKKEDMESLAKDMHEYIYGWSSIMGGAPKTAFIASLEAL